MVIAKDQLFSEVPNFDTPKWINLYKEPEEVIRTVGQNTFIIEPKNDKIYIDGFPITKKEWQRVIDGEEVEVTDDDGKTITIVKRNGDIFFNEKPFTSETQPITTTIMENENPDMPSGTGTPRTPFGNNPGTNSEEPGYPGNPRKNNPYNPNGDPGTDSEEDNPGIISHVDPHLPEPRPKTPGKLQKKKKITNIKNFLNNSIILGNGNSDYPKDGKRPI